MFAQASIAVMFLLGTLTLPSAFAGGRPVIELFEAVPDCIFPNPRLGVVAYRVSGGITRIRIEALHRGGRVRAFYQSTFTAPIPGAGSAGVADPAATSDVEAYRITVTGEGGAVVRRELKFRYRRANFELIPPTSHIRLTSGSGRTALYQSHARLLNVDLLSCSFALSLGFGAEARATGTAEIATDRSGDPIVRCFVTWPRVRDANAGGNVEWTARVRDRCTQGRITQEARVNSIR